MTDSETTPTVVELTAALRQARPDLDDVRAALARAVYRRLSSGRPVTDDELAADTGQTLDQVAATLAAWPGVFRDDAGAVVGFWGLTVLDMPPHRFRVDGVPLSTWCAFDTLFLPPILAATAHVESVDALTGDPITLTVTADGTATTSQPSLLVSFLDPAGKFDDDIITRFCHYVHFFTDRANGRTWTAAHPGTFLLTLDDAVTVAADFAQDLTDRPGRDATTTPR
jgi:alkylmercury lyase